VLKAFGDPRSLRTNCLEAELRPFRRHADGRTPGAVVWTGGEGEVDRGQNGDLLMPFFSFLCHTKHENPMECRKD
jgi:hypothetical protein